MELFGYCFLDYIIFGCINSLLGFVFMQKENNFTDFLEDKIIVKHLVKYLPKDIDFLNAKLWLALSPMCPSARSCA